MGVFDIIELQNHIKAINEYLLYMDAHKEEFSMCSNLISGHLWDMKIILDKLEK